MAPLICNGIPILSSNTIPIIVPIKTTKDIFFFHAGTSSNFDSSSFSHDSSIFFISGNNLCPKTEKYKTPHASIGNPIFAKSKKLNFNDKSSKALCAIKFPGAPIRVKFPPIAAASTNGIKSLERANPDLSAIPTTTGINIAAVPVFESIPDKTPTIIIIAIISCFSVLANLVTIPPILLAIPVSNKAPPTINMATKSITLVLINPAKAVLESNTPVTTNPKHTVIDVTARGIFSHINMTAANIIKQIVIDIGLIKFLL